MNQNMISKCFEDQGTIPIFNDDSMIKNVQINLKI